MNKYHISLELPKILLTLSEMTSCEEARLAALSLQPSGDFFEVQKRLSETGSCSYTHSKIRRALVRRPYKC